jgi:hypothetical protein
MADKHGWAIKSAQPVKPKSRRQEINRRFHSEIVALGSEALKHFLADIEEDPAKCYSPIRPSRSCEAIWDGIDRTCEAPTRK